MINKSFCSKYMLVVLWGLERLGFFCGRSWFWVNIILGAWEDGSVNKLLGRQALLAEFQSPAPTWKHWAWQYMLIVPELGRQRIPGACWPDSLAWSELSLKNQVESDWGGDLMLTSGSQCVRAHMRAHECVHTDILKTSWRLLWCLGRVKWQGKTLSRQRQCLRNESWSVCIPSGNTAAAHKPQSSAVVHVKY